MGRVYLCEVVFNLMLQMFTGKFSPEIFFEGSKCKENLNLNIKVLVNKEEKAVEFIGGRTLLK